MHLSADWAGHHDGLVWELTHTCRDIPPAPFAGDNELFTPQDWEVSICRMLQYVIISD